MIPTAQLYPTTAAVAVSVYTATNHNGTRDTGEAGLSGWTVFIDSNNNGALDSGEPTAVSDVNGFYGFTGVAPGAYALVESLQNGWSLTSPAGGPISATLAAGQVSTARNFGNQSIGDVIAPTALLTASNLTTAASPSYTFTVTYSDNSAIKASTIDGNDLLVTGPGYSQPATLISASSTNAASIIATYAILAPTNNGTYTVTMNAGQVTDTAGNPVAAGSIGTFSVNLAGGLSGTVYTDANVDH